MSATTNPGLSSRSSSGASAEGCAPGSTSSGAPSGAELSGAELSGAAVSLRISARTATSPSLRPARWATPRPARRWSWRAGGGRQGYISSCSVGCGSAAVGFGEGELVTAGVVPGDRPAEFVKEVGQQVAGESPHPPGGHLEPGG